MKSPSCRMGFLRFCRPASVPVCLPRWRCAYRGYKNRTPDKVRSTASGENYAMFAPLSPFNAK
ncbi:hypothetical protein IE980_19995 [Klebsiella pneumoniae]|uniref:Uncharacterized protein n=1 Tax=Klebsiella pneumoniae TaxID=573 RepID=A0A927E7C3_KLEPN|nr:hypothetical protein [Klebsiella pneumoniae]